MIESFLPGVQLVFEPTTIIVIIASAIFGLVVGAVPGMTATLAAALLIPFTFFLEPVPAVAAVITMSAMAIFAGDIPATLLRIPGTAASAAYTEDAYRMGQSGKSTLALGLSLVSSVVGGILGTIVLIVMAPVLGEFALRFSSIEYFWVAVLGLTAAVIVSQGSQVKGGIGLMIGLLISTIGLDVTLGHPRFTMGLSDLLRGVDFLPALIGLFGIAEVLRYLTRGSSETWTAKAISATNGVSGSVREVVRTVWKYKGRVLTGAATGGSVGFLPGAGADIAAWVSYAITRNSSREGYKFGKGNGHPEPIVGASSANNAAVSASYIPTLSFGIPGDTITAIVIGVLLARGVTPGPGMFTDQTDLLVAIFVTFIVANILMLPLGALLIKSSSYIVGIPRRLLMPLVVVVCIVGGYSINNSSFEVLIIVVMGALGYILLQLKFPIAPVVLGIVLGPVIESNFVRSVLATDWDIALFVTRPISGVLATLVVIVLLLPLIKKVVSRGIRYVIGSRWISTNR